MAMRKVILFLSLFLFISANPVLCRDDKAPDFTLNDIEGNAFEFSKISGKQAALLFFWTTWCPHCRSAISRISQEQEALAKDGVALLAINIEESKERVGKFIEDLKANGRKVDFPILIDEQAQAAKSYSVIGIPTFILVDKQGNIVFKNHYFPDGYKDKI